MSVRARSLEPDGHSDGDAQAIEDAFRAILLSRYRAYRARGLAGIAPYARAGPATRAADELAAFNRGARATRSPGPLSR